MKLNVSEDWYRKMAEVEDDAEIGAGGILAEPSVPVAALRALVKEWQDKASVRGELDPWGAELAALCDQVEQP